VEHAYIFHSQQQIQQVRPVIVNYAFLSHIFRTYWHSNVSIFEVRAGRWITWPFCPQSLRTLSIYSASTLTERVISPKGKHGPDELDAGEAKSGRLRTVDVEELNNWGLRALDAEVVNDWGSRAVDVKLA
jgi:hypothetical protein